MSFSAKGVPQAFARSNTSNNKRTERKIDKLITITNYDLGNRQINGVDEKGVTVSVTVRPEAIARNLVRAQTNPGTTAKWEGHAIDQRMASNLLPGQKIVLERASVQNSQTVNGTTVQTLVTDYIRSTRDPSPEKTFEGLFSISSYQGRVFLIQRWDQPNAILVSDAAAMEEFYGKVDAAFNAYQNKEPVPTYGFQARVVLPSANSKDPCTAIDLAPTIDWISREVDEQQRETSPGHPLNSDKLKAILFDAEDGYIRHVNDHFPEEQYPGRFIEITTYRNYRAGPMSRNMEIPDREYDPLYQMTHTPTRLAIDDTTFVMEKNIAALGVLQLSADKVDLTTRSFVTRNIAVQLHVNGPKGHVHSWIRTHDGRVVRPHESLRQKTSKETAETPAQSNSMPQDFGQMANQAPAAPVSMNTPIQTPAASTGPSFDESDWDFDDDPFSSK